MHRKHSPKQVRCHVLLSPESAAPFFSSECDFMSMSFVISFPISVAAEKEQDVVKIVEIYLHGYVVQPGLYTVCKPDIPVRRDSDCELVIIPFWIDCRLKNQ